MYNYSYKHYMLYKFKYEISMIKNNSLFENNYVVCFHAHSDTYVCLFS